MILSMQQMNNDHDTQVETWNEELKLTLSESNYLSAKVY